MFNSLTELDPNHFFSIFKCLSTGLHCQNSKFYDNQAKRELNKYTQNVKPEMKAKFSETDQFFTYVFIVGSEMASHE